MRKKERKTLKNNNQELLLLLVCEFGHDELLKANVSKTQIVDQQCAKSYFKILGVDRKTDLLEGKRVRMSPVYKNEHADYKERFFCEAAPFLWWPFQHTLADTLAVRWK